MATTGKKASSGRSAARGPARSSAKTRSGSRRAGGSTSTTKNSASGSRSGSTASRTRGSAARERIAPRGDARFVRRDARGRFEEVEDVGRSLTQDRARRAKTVAKRGHGDRGDRRR